MRARALLCAGQAGLLVALAPATIQPAVQAAPAGVAYHVDCSAGNDAATGTSPAQAWRTLERVHQAWLAPGDSLLLKRGCAWNGTLRIGWQGSPEAPIHVSPYGTGELPVIQSGMDNVDAVFVTGSYVVLEGVWARGLAPRREAGCADTAVGQISGFRFAGQAGHNVLRHSVATGLTDGVKVERSAHHQHILHNTLSGNNMMAQLTRSAWDDYGAFGVNVHGDDNEVAYNEISGSDACSFDFGRDGAAVEIHGGQRNDVHHNRAIDNLTFTELGDTRSADNRFAYNIVSSRVAGASFLITRGGADGYGPVRSTRAYHNTVYLTGGNATAVVCAGGCAPDILTLKNNIVWSEHQVAWVDGPFDESHNLFWRADGAPVFKVGGINARSQRADPRFRSVAPGGLDFHLTADSPAIGAGMADSFSTGYRSDFDGIAVPAGSRVDAGALTFNEARPPSPTPSPAPTTATATRTPVPATPSATRALDTATPSRTATRTPVSGPATVAPTATETSGWPGWSRPPMRTPRPRWR